MKTHTREQLIRDITAEVSKAVPDIMELKFGCKVVRKNGRSGVIYDVIDVSDYGEGMHGVYSYRVVFDSSMHAEFTSLTDFDWEILGREVQLADVLAAINRKEGMPLVTLNANGVMTLWKAGEDGRIFIVDIETYWDLSKPLSGQSDETLELISGIIGNGK